MRQSLFSQQELAEMGRRTLDRLLEVIESGDAQKASQLAQRMYNEFLAMHDLYCNGVTALASFIGRRFGDNVLEEAMGVFVKSWWLPNLDELPQDPEELRHRVKMFVAGLRGHLQPLHIEEDDEKVVIQLQPCGSGGRLVLNGKYEGPDAFYTVRGPQFLTFGRQSFPVYCTHDPWMEKLGADKNGTPFAIVEPAHELGKQHCSVIIYKDPAKVPAKYYERLGLKKP